MKQTCLFLLVALLGGIISSAQVKVGDNPGTIHPSAILEMESSKKGFLVPRLTVTQRDAILKPETGLIIFNVTSGSMQVNVGSPDAPAWQNFTYPGIDPSSNGTAVIKTITPGTGTGNFLNGMEAVNVYQTIQVEVATPGTYNISTRLNNGIVFSATGAFAEARTYSVSLKAAGKPIAPGNTRFQLNLPIQCSFDRLIN